MHFYHCLWWLLNNLYLVGVAALFRKLFGYRGAIIAVATTALHWIDEGRPAGHRVYTYLVLYAVTALIGGIAVRTVVAMVRGQFLPPTSQPPRSGR